MLTRVIRIQLILFTVLTVLALVVLGWYYLRLPSVMGVGQYTLTADLPGSGGLYRTANVTYRGITIGKVTAIEPTERGARATLSISDNYKIPLDAVANVHSVSAIGEQYIDLVSDGKANQYFSPGQTITKGTVPREIGPALDAANRGIAVLPKEKLSALLDETSQAVGGLGPALQRLVDGTQAIVGEFTTNINDINDIVDNTGPVIDSQVGHTVKGGCGGPHVAGPRVQVFLDQGVDAVAGYRGRSDGGPISLRDLVHRILATGAAGFGLERVPRVLPVLVHGFGGDGRARAAGKGQRRVVGRMRGRVIVDERAEEVEEHVAHHQGPA